LGGHHRYFAFTSLRIPPEKRQFMMGAFLLSSATALISNLAYTLGESFYWLFLLFPAEWGVGQAAGEQMIGRIVRVTGLGPASTAVVCFMLMRFGLRGLLDLGKPWRGMIFVAAVVAGLYSGFRSHFVLVILLLAGQFFAEKLHKTRFLVIALISTALITGFLVAFSETLPLAVQRTLTVFPLKLDPAAVQDAQASVEWRLEMWRVLLDEIPKYFWLGKGYAINPSDLYLSDVSVKLGVYTPWDAAIIAGDYHNGPLTLIIPFGIFGVLTFVAFLIAGGRVLWKNYRYGDPSIQNINTFLLSLFAARVLFYCFIFGAFYIDIAVFAGIIGLSVAMNEGVREAPSAVRVEAPVPQRGPIRRLPALQPA
jgi:O-antigen ligase